MYYNHQMKQGKIQKGIDIQKQDQQSQPTDYQQYIYHNQLEHQIDKSDKDYLCKEYILLPVQIYQVNSHILQHYPCKDRILD